MNKSEQAQAIAEIKERVIDCPKANQMDLEDIAFSKLDREKLLEIVDSQAQKIQAQEALSEINRNALDTAAELLKSKSAEIDMLRQKITELSAPFQKAGNGAADLAVKCSEQEMTIAKLTAENEKLKTNYSAVIATNRQRG